MSDRIDIGDVDDKLLEEVGKVIQIRSRIKRYGFFTRHPECLKPTNLDELRYKLDDLMKAAEKMHTYLDIVQRIHDAGNKRQQ